MAPLFWNPDISHCSGLLAGTCAGGHGDPIELRYSAGDAHLLSASALFGLSSDIHHRNKHVRGHSSCRCKKCSGTNDSFAGVIRFVLSLPSNADGNWTEPFRNAKMKTVWLFDFQIEKSLGPWLLLQPRPFIPSSTH